MGVGPFFCRKAIGASICRDSELMGTDYRIGEIEKILTPTLHGMGFNLVRALIDGKKNPRLQVMVERQDCHSVSINDCTAVSRALSALLDIEDPIPSTYVLEVSSPGIDRPLVAITDYERFLGRYAHLEIEPPISGRRHYRGILDGVDNGAVKILAQDGVFLVPFTQIRKAKLVPTKEEVAVLKQDASQVRKYDD